MIDPARLSKTIDDAMPAMAESPIFDGFLAALGSLVPMIGAYYALAMVHREGVNGLPDGRCHCPSCRSCASRETLVLRLRYPGSRKHKRAIKRLGLRVTRVVTPEDERTGPPCHFCGRNTLTTTDTGRLLCASREAAKFGGWCSPETDWAYLDSLKKTDTSGVRTGEVP